MRHSLDGTWNFAFTPPEKDCPIVSVAQVPGNVEPELVRLGLLNDYMPADSKYATMNYELVDDWTFSRTFDAPPLATGCTRELVFDGIDTVAEIYLNGEQICSCANMHRQWRIDVAEKLLPHNNELQVIIRSADRYARRLETATFPPSRNSSLYGSQPYLRKARHQWGWDNAPRLLTAGIWRAVYLEDMPAERFDDVYVYTDNVEETIVRMGFHWSYRMPEDKSTLGYTIRYSLSDADGVAYEYEEEVLFPRGAHRAIIPLEKLKLWWPSGFGEPHLYTATLEMRDGDNRLLASQSTRVGIRTVRLEETEDVDEHGNGTFLFTVNNEKIMIRGTNWKPADALASKADEKVLHFLPLAKELNCNMVRIWGGGIYEDHPFFDYCDENGLLVWQDFMFACEMPPTDDWFCEEVRREATEIVRKLRNHPSLAVWCGDNENDLMMRYAILRNSNFLPSQLKISREVLKEVTVQNDPYRAYVASSPRYSDRFVETKRRGIRTFGSVEEHLYPIEYAKALRACKSSFIGETGPWCFNPFTEDEAIFAREKARCERLWNVTEIPSIVEDIHQSDSYFARCRAVGRKNCLEMFGRDFSLDEWKDYALAIGILCADIFKDAVEYTRVMRWRKTGVLWWSLADMWPMLFNYSVVDCNGRRKLPFYWIRQSQRDFALIMVRKEVDANPELYAVNDTLTCQSGTYRITAYDTDGTAHPVCKGSFEAEKNAVVTLPIPTVPEAQELWLIEWTTSDGRTHCNHFATGARPYPFEVWKHWNTILKTAIQDDRNE